MDTKSELKIDGEYVDLSTTKQFKKGRTNHENQIKEIEAESHKNTELWCI